MMKDNLWQLQEAKSRFTQLVEAAMHEEPQIVTKHGDKAVVVLSFEEYSRITKSKKGLVDFFRDSPLADAGIEITRSNALPRDSEL